MPIICAHRFSTIPLNLIDRLAEAHANADHAQARQNLDEMFGEGDDEVEFDFDSSFNTTVRSHFMAKQETQQKAATVTIDGTEYNLNDLTDNAKAQLTNLRVTDQEIERLNQQLAIAQTARRAYANALAEELPKQTKH
ncbi:DUF6447 family protein [Halomonas llamarensis]|uniref:DUF6447 family protein n=1 Tax=Halomonas llamarensis TaxID=2945104 RepID=A0ABT0SPQ2_9GAMM|nr:DUF6447 family protein [Halomonas llamarensis]MCL7929601.1 DUF6447 family protein [Halomonas llamarensis]